MIDLAGQRVVITGAGGGVGTALTRAFASAGATVVACDLPGTDLAGHQAHLFDLRDPAAVQQAARDILAQGPVDVVDRKSVV